MAARVFTEFAYQTRKIWARERRVVAKAEYLDKGENPRFVVSSLTADEWSDQDLYEKIYCARGEMENRIKGQMCLFAYRLSTEEMKGNQLRLYLSALAYTLMEALRRLALKGTEWAEAQVDTIRASSCSRSARWCASAPARAAADELLLSVEAHLRPGLQRVALLNLSAVPNSLFPIGCATAPPFPAKIDPCEKLRLAGRHRITTRRDLSHPAGQFYDHGSAVDSLYFRIQIHTDLPSFSQRFCGRIRSFNTTSANGGEVTCLLIGIADAVNHSNG